MSSGSLPVVSHTIADLRRRLDVSAGSVALVPTMGALHEGHLALIRHARRVADTVVVSVFVNPLQFGPAEDFDRYPRTLDADVAAAGSVGADIVFAPSVAEMYPGGPPGIAVHAGPIGERFEGASRPGHFDGMLTVVAKLFLIAQPVFAVFGRKDAQQLFLVRRMVADLNIPIEILAEPTQREPDGLARSSRNRFLGPGQRETAAVLPRALAAAAAAHSRNAATQDALAVLESRPEVNLDYFAIIDPATFLPIDGDYSGPALALLAARVGAVRLIDNRELVVTEPDV